MERGRTLTQKSFLMKQQSYKKLSSKQLVHLYMRSSYVSGSNLQGIRKNLQGKSAISAEKHEYYVGVAKKIEEKEQRREQEVGEAEMDRQERRRVESIVRIQAFFRRHHKRKAYKQLVKQARYRRHILAEIISTEAQYVHDLQLTIDLLLTPLEAVLKPGEVQGLFANVKQIHQLNSQLLGELQQRFSKYHPNCTVADVMVKHAPSFAIYFEYYNNFKTQEQLQHTLKASNPKFLHFLHQVPLSKELRFLTFDDFLIKPVQRLPKYVLLLKDLLKHTRKNHPDYPNIHEAFNLFTKVNHDNNDKLNQITSYQMLSQLQNQFGSKVNILDPNRRYIKSESMYMLRQNKKKGVEVHILSDQVLIAKKKDNKFYQSVALNSETTIKELGDTEHFSHLFSIRSKVGTVTLMQESASLKRQTVEELEKVIGKVEGKRKIEVRVVGTEERSGLLKSSVVYIIEVKHGCLAQKVYLSFKECFKVQEAVHKDHPGVDLMERVHFESGHDTKVIEARKIQIENFLSSLLNDSPSAKVLQSLGLTSALYDDSFRDSSVSYGPLSRRSLRYSPQRSISFALSSFSSQSLSVSQSKRKDTKITINDHKVTIDLQAKVFDLFSKMEDRYELESTWDFKFLAPGHKHLRPLEDDEIIEKLPDKTLLFKKYYFLSQQSEVYEYLCDRSKLNFVYNQMIKELKQATLTFKFQDLCLICAAHLLNNCTTDAIHKMLPSSVYKSTKKDMWLSQVNTYIKKLNTLSAKSIQKDQLLKLFVLCLMRQQNPTIGALKFELLDDKKEVSTLVIAYDGTLLNETTFVDSIQIQPGSIIINGKKYATMQGYQIKSVWEEYEQLAREMKEMDEDFVEQEAELKEALHAFGIQSYDERRRTL